MSETNETNAPPETNPLNSHEIIQVGMGEPNNSVETPTSHENAELDPVSNALRTWCEAYEKQNDLNRARHTISSAQEALAILQDPNKDARSKKMYAKDERLVEISLEAAIERYRVKLQNASKTEMTLTEEAPIVWRRLYESVDKLSDDQKIKLLRGIYEPPAEYFSRTQHYYNHLSAYPRVFNPRQESTLTRV